MNPDEYPALTKLLEDALAGPPTIIIHNLGHALGALAAAEAAGTAVRLLSAPGAAAHGGAAWLNEVVAAARARHPRAEPDPLLDSESAPTLAPGPTPAPPWGGGARHSGWPPPSRSGP